MYFKRLFESATITRISTAVVVAFSLSACSDFTGTLQKEEPRIIETTRQNILLRALPAPSTRINIAVYDFPDLTGQYKETGTGQTLSRAVSQGGSSVLIKALQDAGQKRWFVVLDRAGLQDLVRERQIVTEMRRLYRNETEVNPRALSPLLHSGIILQGGIIGYDTSTLTGGVGARYLGIGANTEWRADTVTVSLRAVSTETGEVLTTTVVQKSIASSLIQGSIFRYVALDELLESEAGVTTNEPRLVALQQAVEKAVYGMIMQGVEAGIWSMADKSAQNRLLAAYKSEALGVNANRLPGMARPVTRSPAKISQTVPKAPIPVSARPPKEEPISPPPPASGSEVLG
jgi:curli production assembly/transport component CsgG